MANLAVIGLDADEMGWPRRLPHVRNASGLGFLPDGRLLALDQGADDRGSRPVGNVPDLLFDIRDGAWCGWQRNLLRVDSVDWSTHELPVGMPPHRPIDVAFAPDGETMYVLDFGEFEMTDEGVPAACGGVPLR